MSGNQMNSQEIHHLTSPKLWVGGLHRKVEEMQVFFMESLKNLFSGVLGPNEKEGAKNKRNLKSFWCKFPEN